jgi:Tfp pilus assembly protein FimT
LKNPVTTTYRGFTLLELLVVLIIESDHDDSSHEWA